jgi:hypothetical protein
MYFSRRIAALTLLFLVMGAKAQLTPDKPIQITVQWDKPDTTLLPPFAVPVVAAEK